MRRLTNNDVLVAAAALRDRIFQHRHGLRSAPLGTINIWGIPRGGIPATYALVSVSPSSAFIVRDDPKRADFLIDDLADSGATRARWAAEIGVPVGVLFTKRLQDAADGYALYGGALAGDEWVVFPWEAGDTVGADDIVIRLLQFIGEDPERPGLIETPKRVVKAWQEWFGGYKIEPKEVLKTFADGAEKVDEMVVVRDIPVYSHCEHHLAPFFGVAHVAYIPNGSIVGLSKLPRLVDIFARRLQVQERLTNQIADALNTELSPKGVGVVIECRHLCMESRGVRKAGATTVTSAMRGVMFDIPAARAELLSLVRR